MLLPACVSVPSLALAGVPSCVRAALMALAMPKSVTTAVPADSKMLSGLMSRCTTPSPCA